jgi:hypothetical protein
MILPKNKCPPTVVRQLPTNNTAQIRKYNRLRNRPIAQSNFIVNFDEVVAELDLVIRLTQIYSTIIFGARTL